MRQEYLLADRSMGALPVSFSLLASFMSAITLLGVCAENYNYGTQFVLINVSYAIATPIAAYCYLPVFYRLSEYSVYQVGGLSPPAVPPPVGRNIAVISAIERYGEGT